MLKQAFISACGVAAIVVLAGLAMGVDAAATLRAALVVGAVVFPSLVKRSRLSDES